MNLLVPVQQPCLLKQESTRIQADCCMTEEFCPGDHLWKPGGRVGGTLYDHHLIFVGPAGHDNFDVVEASFRRGRVVAKTLPVERLQRFKLYERPSDPEACLQRALAC
eukprot:3497371-Amphidinium_carterae.2